ncbi:MAG: TolC family protein [Gemmatimonadaceae bacterium]
MHKHTVGLFLGLLALVGGMNARSAGAQITLAQALQQADHSAYANREASATADAQRARAIAPLQGILPDVRLEAGYARTTDPIGVFGNKLRQGIATQADFDPARLNSPAAMTNYQGGVVVEQPLFNADAWAGRTAARRGADASQARAIWTRLSIRVDVVRAYYGAVLASERTVTLRAAARSAHARVVQTDAMVRQGMVTRSDALLASVRAGDIDAQLAEAEGGVETARRQLAMLLGLPETELLGRSAAPSSLPSTARIRAVVEEDTAATPTTREDVRGAQLQSASAVADALRARTTYLPRINSFVRYDWNAPNRPFDGERNWTVGIMAAWNPFGNAARISDMRTTSAQASAVKAQADAAEAQASLDVAQTRTALSVALIRLGIAEQSVAQSTEAHRIISRKYEGGLASIVDLLDAQSVEMNSALALSDARYRVIVAAAERRRALGGDPASLTALDQGGTPTTAKQSAANSDPSVVGLEATSPARPEHFRDPQS